MKKLIYLIFIPLLFFIYSCGNKCCTPPPQRTAEINAQRNGAEWAPPYVNGTIDQLDAITISATGIQAANYSKTDTLNLKISYTDNGVYKLSGNQAFYGTFNANGTLTSYQLDPSFNNQVTITGYHVLYNSATLNPDPIKITGTFSIKFIDPNNPAGISFLDGSFYCIMTRQ